MNSTPSQRHPNASESSPRHFPRPMSCTFAAPLIGYTVALSGPQDVDDPHGACKPAPFGPEHSLDRFWRRPACRMWGDILALSAIKPGSTGIFLTLCSVVSVYHDRVTRHILHRDWRHCAGYSRYAVWRRLRGWRTGLGGRRLCRQRACSYRLLGLSSTAECSADRWTPVSRIFAISRRRWR